MFGTSFTTLETLKRIRQAQPEAKINDIGLAVVGGALRAYLLDDAVLTGEWTPPPVRVAS